MKINPCQTGGRGYSVCMAFELSFSEDFFYGPYDFDGIEFDKEKPTSVYQAIHVMSDEDYALVAKEVFDCDDPDKIDTGMIMSKIRETNSCTSLSSPVEVWIDEQGYHSVLVYDS